MLTITPTNNTVAEARITVPPETTPEDRARLVSLVEIFYGHHVRGQDAYVFTEARGRKCFALWKAGFTATPPNTKNHRCAIRHPAIRGSLNISTAIKMVALVAEKPAETAPVVMEASAEEMGA